MPNHITNILTIEADDELVSLIREEMSGENGVFIDFSKIWPLPEELLNTQSPAKIVSQEDYDAFIARVEAGDLTKYEKDFGVVRPLTQEMHDDLIMKYGHAEWRSWQVENWGTKWNAYNQDELSENVISFETAWSTPHSLIERLSMRYPDALFTVKFADEDFGSNTGQYTYKNGEASEVYVPQSGSLEAYRAAIEVMGEGRLAYYLEDENLEESDLESKFYRTIIQLVLEFELLGDYPKIVLDLLEEKSVQAEKYHFAKRIKDERELLMKRML
jgi:hypothetical protein